MAYVLDNDLTDAYLQTLIARVGFTDVTAAWSEYGPLYAVQDLNGAVTFYSAMSTVRDEMVRQYLIQQNS